MKLDLEKVTIKDLKGKIVGEVNGRESIANILYTHVGEDNLLCMDLAKKMIAGDKDTDYSRKEVVVIRNSVYKNCIPAMIDAVIPILNGAEK